MASPPTRRSRLLNSRSLVQKVTPLGHNHRHPVPVRRLYDLAISPGAAGLYDGLYTNLGQGFEAVGEREEGVARRDRPLRPLTRLFDRELRRLDPTSLARPDTDRGPAFGQHDGVALDVFGDPPGEEEIAKFLRRGVRSRHKLILRVIFDA